MPHAIEEAASPVDVLERYRREASKLGEEYLLVINSFLGMLDIVESARDWFPELDDALRNLAPEIDTLLSRIPSPYRKETRQLKQALHRLDLVARLEADDDALLTTLRSVRGCRSSTEPSDPVSTPPDGSAPLVN